MQLKYLFLITLLFSLQVLYAGPADGGGGKAKYMKQTVVFKLRKEYAKLFESDPAKLPSLYEVIQQGGVLKLGKMFSNVEAPAEKVNRHGLPLTDITSIYLWTYTSGLAVEDVVKMVLATQLVEYAEPWYIRESSYVPNDPAAQSTAPGMQNQEFYLKRIKAFEAWDISKGDTSVVIGIIDTGVELTHPDLAGNIKYNYADPIDGIDNDNDGYLDDFYGFDVSSDNDNNPTAASTAHHGVFVSGCAAAVPDNGVGIAGTGYNCKFIPIKASCDACGSSVGYWVYGLIYAIKKNVNVINLSLGGVGAMSQMEQDIINYAVINKNIVVVAAGGNSGLDERFYPASYDNVLSVAASDTITSSVGKVIDKKWGKIGGSTFNYWMDINAQGTRVYSTTLGGTYTTGSGTSFSSPLVAGAAALAKSYYPGYSAQQIMELLRVTADQMDTFPETIQFKEKLGKGRLNMYRALTDNTSPAVRMYGNKLFNKYSEYVFPGDTAMAVLSLRNFLRPSSNLTVTLTCLNPKVKMIDSTVTLGAIGMMDTTLNVNDPFTFYVSPAAGYNELLLFRIGYSDPATSYKDYQYFEAYINPDYITIDTNNVEISSGSNGRIGYNDPGNTQGTALLYKNSTNSLLWEAGLMVSSSSDKVSDCVRGDGVTDQDFAPVKSIYFVSPEKGSSLTARTVFADTSITTPVGVVVEQKILAWGAAPDDNYIVLEYNITNISGATIDTLDVGLFADWDIGNSVYNSADYDTSARMGYAYERLSPTTFAGISLLTDQSPSCFSMENSIGGPGNINPNDAFTTSQKYKTLHYGIARPQAGMQGDGDDISHVVGGSMYGVKDKETRQIAFAIVVSDNLTSLKKSATLAADKYKATTPPPVPTSNKTGGIPESSIVMYPNPAADHLDINFSLQGWDKVSLTMYDLLGNQLLTRSLALPADNKVRLDLSSIPNGVYFINFRVGEYTVTRKFVKNG